MENVCSSKLVERFTKVMNLLYLVFTNKLFHKKVNEKCHYV